VVEPVDDGPLAAGRRRLDGPHPSQVVAEPHAELEPAQLAAARTTTLIVSPSR
jgi:hypothetical protein